MAAAYWLLAAGIGVLIIGYFLAAIRGGPESTFIDDRMSDDEIVNQLNKQKGDPIAGFFVLAGYLMIFVSLIWRISNKFM